MKLKKKVLIFSEIDRAALERIVKKGWDSRMCHRAQMHLYFSEGCAAKDIATWQDLHLDTVYNRRKRCLKDCLPHWRIGGVAGLPRR